METILVLIFAAITVPVDLAEELDNPQAKINRVEKKIDKLEDQIENYNTNTAWFYNSSRVARQPQKLAKYERKLAAQREKLAALESLPQNGKYAQRKQDRINNINDRIADLEAHAKELADKAND